MKILQICHKMPYPPIDGGAQAIYNTTRGFIENKIDVTVFSVNPSRNYIDINLLPKKFIDETSFVSVKVDTKIKPITILLNFFKKESYFIERFNSKYFKNKLINILEQNEFDIIQLEHLYMCIYLNTIRKNSKAKIVLRPQNVEYIIWERYLNNIKNPFKKFIISVATKRLKSFEQNIVKEVDGIIGITDDDVQIYKTFCFKTPIIDIPMGFDFGSIYKFDFEKQYETFPIFYHLGSMDWLPNEEAMRWFVSEILPIIINNYKDIIIHIAGRNMQNFFYQKMCKNLIINGEVTNPIIYQEDKAIMFVPLLSGSGIRAKIVEGLALGKTIISTTIGAQGIKYTDNLNILIADTPNEFVTQVGRCIKSKELCIKIGKNARALANENYHYIVCARQIIEFYKVLLMKDEV